MMNRRGFLAALALGPLVRLPALAGETASVPSPNAGPYEAVFDRVPAAADDFACEKEAAVVGAFLQRQLAAGKLPFPEGVQAANIQAARFYVLPQRRVRYEFKSPGVYATGTWEQVWNNGAIAGVKPVAGDVVRSERPWFRDVTGHAFGSLDSFRQQLLRGNTWWRARLDAAAGLDVYGNNGIAAADIDGDGWDEIYVCQPAGLPNRLYKNRGDGTFDDITEASGLAVLDDTTCALFADFRNSGKQDAVVLRGSGPLLFLNDGNGHFTYAPDAFRFRTAPQGSFTGMAAADYDRDGKLDLYLCCYVYFQSEDQYRYPTPYHDAQNGPPNFLFRNRLEGANGAFEDVTAETGLSQNNNRFSFAPAWCDTTGGGWPDLYVANDFGRNNFYRNREGKFRDEAAQAGVEDMGPGMSAAWFDYDGDGRPDLYVANMWTEAGQRIVHAPVFKPAAELQEAYRRHTKGNSLYRNRGDGTFEETGAAEGVEMGRWSWCADACDFDNDGVPEIFITAGMLSFPQREAARHEDLNSFFWRQVVAKSPTTDKPAPDYENGWNAINQLIREDYGWCGGEPNVFYVRRGERFCDYSGVSGLDVADDSRAFAITDFDGDGSLDIVLKSRQGPQIRAFQNHAGAGRPVVVLRLRGTQSNRDAIGARVEVNGRVQYLSCGSGYLSQHSKQLHFALGSAAEARANIVWPSGLKQEIGGLKPGRRYDIVEGSSVLNEAPLGARREFAAGCPPGENAAIAADTWLVDAVPLPEKKGPGVIAVEPATDPVFAVFRRYLFEYRAGAKEPFWLLIDDGSRAHKIYVRAPDQATVRADIQSLAAPPPLRGLPFAGTFYQKPHRNTFKLGAAFYWAGYPQQAIPYLEEVVRRDPSNWKTWNAIGRIQLDGGNAPEALAAYKRALAIRPDYGPALVGSGEAYANLNDPAAAEPLFREALRVNPADADAANQLGLACVNQGRAAEAKQWFERAISIRKDHTGAINNLGVWYFKQGQTNDAIAAFRYGLQQAPGDRTLYLNLGRVYVATGEREKARELMRELLERKPGDTAALRALQELDRR